MTKASRVSPASQSEREFAFSEHDFKEAARLAYEHAGIALSESKSNLVYSRLSRRLRALRLDTFRDYRTYLASNPEEVQNFVNAISTNLTKFFREAHHLEHFADEVARPFALSAAKGAGKRLRVWSAGCSTGEEPYSIAMVLAGGVRNIERHDVRILATDIDTEVTAKGDRGEYPAAALNDIPKEYHDYLIKSARGREQIVTMSDELRSMIAFKRLNLLDSWPFHGPFDAIFCRNVMIYFDAPTKRALVERFAQMIRPGGWLYIGHSESLHGFNIGLRLVGRTIYHKEG